ncbi:MAG: cyclic nucleotide-binding domain-containing protein, partial [Alphaproteobacteria bacterium]|nr:cyclic nucleotide-binding domain-containing protein [Alphaproteobacteria bacterium]
MAVPPRDRTAAARPGLVQRRAAAAIGSLLATIEGTESDEAAETAVLDRPQRWDTPFDPEMSYSDVIWLLQRPELRDIDADKFPSRIPLTGILRNDARIVRCEAGDIVVREGDYGNSAFLVLEGKLRVVVAPSLPRNVLGRQRVQKRGFFEALTQLWSNKLVPEVRDVSHYSGEAHRTDDSGRTRVFLQDFHTVLDKHRTAELNEGALFGELAALGRTPRTATVFAESAATLLEIRWQGLRELRTYDVNWRKRIDENYRKNALQSHLKAVDLFSGLSEEAIAKIGETTIFETFGGFDWSVSYKKGAKARGEGKADAFADEPLIVREGDYTDGLLLVRAGFARVSVTFGNSERTLTYLGAGDVFGLHELYESWRRKEQVPAETTIRALGYVDVLRVPTRVLEEQVFPHISVKPQRFAALAERPVAEDGLLEWSVRERFINGTKAMLIDLERCVRCDDCVRACA